MNLVELQTFIAIIQTGSLVRASESLNVTQSTVTARLKSLEGQLGQPLVNRQKSGATPTPAGQRLLRYAQTISQLWQQAQLETALPDATSSVCNIACHPDLWHGCAEDMLNFIRDKLPKVATSLWQGSQSEMTHWLRDGLIDIAIGFSPNSTQKQQLFPAIEDDLILVSTVPDSPIKFDPAYIFVEAGEEFARDHSEAYADANVGHMSFSSAWLALDYLLKNRGSAYLPERLVRHHLENGRLFKLGTAPTFTRRAYVVVNKQAYMAWPWFDACLDHILKRYDDTV